MRVLVLDTGKTYGINIYGINDQLMTREFFLDNFLDADGVYETTDEERKKFNTDAEWTFEEEKCFDDFAATIEDLQSCIDGVRDKYIRYGTKISYFTNSKGKNFVI